MLVFWEEILMYLLVRALKLIEDILDIFSYSINLDIMYYQNNKVNILELLISNTIIENIFWSIFILTIGLFCIFTIIGIIKNMITNTEMFYDVLKKFLFSLISIFVMLLFVFMIIIISNLLLEEINNLFPLKKELKLSNMIFDLCVGEWSNGYSILEVDFSMITIRDLLGDYKDFVLNIWPSSWSNNGMIVVDKFMFLPAIITTFTVLVSLIITVINLIKRIYEFLLLYFVMPISMSVIPLDNGRRFKNWIGQFIEKILIAFGNVLSLNITILILPIVNELQISESNSYINSIFRLFLIISGVIIIPFAQKMIIKVLGRSRKYENTNNTYYNSYYESNALNHEFDNITHRYIEKNI